MSCNCNTNRRMTIQQVLNYLNTNSCEYNSGKLWTSPYGHMIISNMLKKGNNHNLCTNPKERNRIKALRRSRSKTNSNKNKNKKK